jgi:histidinol-phosphate phosphatase family protein
MTGRAAVFLDRDGTIIADKHYLSEPDGVELLPKAAQGLRHMQSLGLALVVVSNQSGVGRGYFDMDSVERVNARLSELLAAQGVRLDHFYFCPHAPEHSCHCRKPLPGLILRAAQELGIDPAASFVVGDKPCDVELGLGVGAVSFLVGAPGAGYAASLAPELVVEDLNQAALRMEFLLEQRGFAR